MSSIDKIFQSPDCLPVHLDCAGEMIEFVTMNSQLRRSTLYLARDRVQGPLEQFSLSDLLARKPLISQNQRPGYIFFLPFSGSTLLCRIFESIVGCHVIKEPEVFNELSLEFHRPSDKTGKRAHLFLDILNTLFARTSQATDRVLVKAPNPGSNLLDYVLKHPQSGPVFFIHAPLDFFMTQSLKLGTRIENIKRILKTFSYDLHRSDDEAIACYWALTLKMLKQAQSENRNRTVHIIDSKDLLEDPLATVRMISEKIDLKADDKDLVTAVDHNRKIYSKNPKLNFPHEIINLENARLGLKFQPQIERARSWVKEKFENEKLL